MTAVRTDCYDIIIVGAGLNGSELAAALAQRGWKVLLLERRKSAEHKLCREFLSPEAKDSLESLGLRDTVSALRPYTITHARLTAAGGAELCIKLPGPAWGISRFALDHALSLAAESGGVEVRRGVTVTGAQPEADMYGVFLRAPARPHEGDMVSRAVVIACRRNPLPGLRAAMSGSPVEQTWIGVKSHFAYLALPPEVRLYFFRGGYACLAPIENGRTNVCLLATREAFARAGSVAAMIESAAQLNPALGTALVGGRALAESVCTVAPVDITRAPIPWDRFARMGDAAGMIAPLAGDGMAMALRSAELCSPLAHEFLSGKCSEREWESAYRAAWHREFDGPVRLGRQLQTLLNSPGISAALINLSGVVPFFSSWLVRATRGPHRVTT
jgi:flavin-dependent dehydrogenase